MKAMTLTSRNIMIGHCMLLSQILVSNSLSVRPNNAVFVVNGSLVLPLTQENATNVIWSFSKSATAGDDPFIYSKVYNETADGYYIAGQEDYTLRKDSVQFRHAGKYTARVSTATESLTTAVVLVNVVAAPTCTSDSCSITYSGLIKLKLEIKRDVRSNGVNTNIDEPKFKCFNETNNQSVADATLTEVSCSIDQGSSCSDCVCIVSWLPIDQTTIGLLKLTDVEVLPDDSPFLNCSMTMRVEATVLPRPDVINDANTPSTAPSYTPVSVPPEGKCCPCSSERGFLLSILIILIYTAVAISVLAVYLWKKMGDSGSDSKTPRIGETMQLNKIENEETIQNEGPGG